MALEKEAAPMWNPTNKALGFFSFLSLPLFCTQQINLVSSEMGMLD